MFLKSMFILTLLFTSLYANSCEDTFGESVLNSTFNEGSILFGGASIINNKKKPLRTKHLIMSGPTVLCKSSGGIFGYKRCRKSNTIAPEYNFTVDTGSGRDGVYNFERTINSSKEYISFASGGAGTLNLKGNITIKVQHSFSFTGIGRLNIDGNVVIEAKNILLGGLGDLNIAEGSSLTIKAKDNIVTGGMVGNNTNNFNLLSKGNISIAGLGSLKGIVYAKYLLNLGGGFDISGSTAFKQLTVAGISHISFNKDAVDRFCNPDIIYIDIPKDISIQEGNSGTRDIVLQLTTKKELPSNLKFSYNFESGTAKSNEDYNKNSGTSTIELISKVNDTYRYKVIIPEIIKGDKVVENDEYFYLFLNTDDNKVALTNSRVKVTILNDDSSFVITDSSHNSNQNIKTKVVNKTFTINIFSVDNNNNLINNYTAKNAQVRIIDTNTGAGLTRWQPLDSDIYGVKHAAATLISPKSIKDAKIELKWLNIKTMKTYTQTSSDNFAIRPNKFKLTIPTQTIAGDSFKLEAKALSYLNTATQNYNEQRDVSFKITPHEKKSGCKTGTLTFTQNNFSNGLFSDNNTKYNNVGKVDITVSEKLGSEFAIVDSDDTSSSQRLIQSDTKTITFVPKTFSITPTLTDDNPTSKLTLYANDPSSMGTTLSIKVSATTASGVVLSNYSNSCYANNANVTIYYNNSNSTDNQTLVADKTILSKDSAKFKVKIPKSKYNSDQAKYKIKVNLSRNNQVAKNPNTFSVSKININDGVTNATKNITSNIDAHFYYGRSHAPSPQESTGNSIDAKIYYEIYCKNCDKNKYPLAKGKASIDSVYWYILPNTAYNGFSSGSGTCSFVLPSSFSFAMFNFNFFNPNNLNITYIDNTTMRINTTQNPPYSSRVYYIPNQPYLRYNRFGTALPEHYFDIKLTSASNTWGGEGEKGKTVDTDISKIQNNSLEW